MGLFNFFKKKSNSNESAEDLNLSVLYDLQRQIIELGLKAERHPEYLAIIVNDELELATAVLPNPNTHPLISEILCIAIHPKYFPQGLEERSVGIGENHHTKARYFVGNYMKTIFEPLLESLSDGLQGPLDFKSRPEDKEVLWHVAAGEMQLQGSWEENESPDYAFALQLLADELKSKIPNQKLNWLKIYISRQSDGTIISECNFNNEFWLEGAQKLEALAKNWSDSQFKGVKQFFAFRRCDAFD